jgi:hypothetical protein
MIVTPRQHHMIVIELKEVDQVLLNKFIALNYLPTFKKLFQRGTFLETTIPTHQLKAGNFNTWDIWSSIYGELEQKGITTDLIGNLARYPMYVNFIAHATGKNFAIRTLKLAWELLKTILGGLSIKQSVAILKELTRDSFKVLQYPRNRVFLYTKLQMFCFEFLYQKYLPQFASLHLSHLMHQQPKKSNSLNRGSILEYLQFIEQFLKRLLPFIVDNGLLVIMTNCCQKKYKKNINIKVKLHNITGILKLSDIHHCETLNQTGTDITLHFKEKAEASLAAFKLLNLKVLGEQPLLKIKQEECQLLIQGSVNPLVWDLGNEAWLEHETTRMTARLFDYISHSETMPEPSLNKGWMLLYGNVMPLSNNGNTLEFSQISSLLTDYFT